MSTVGNNFSKIAGYVYPDQLSESDRQIMRQYYSELIEFIVSREQVERAISDAEDEVTIIQVYTSTHAHNMLLQESKLIYNRIK